MVNKIKYKSGFSRSVLTLITGTAIAQAIPLLISPVITRLYSPEDFGVFFIFTTIVGFLSVILSCRYEQAIVLQKHEKNALNMLVLCFALIVFLSTLFFCIVWMLNKEILAFFNIKVLENWLYFVPVTAFFLALFNLLVSYNNRAKEYKSIAQSTVVKSISLAIIQVVAGVCGSGFGGLILGQMIAQFFANIRLAINITKNKHLVSTICFGRILTLAKKHSNFPKYNLPHALVNTISSSLPIYYFSYFFDYEVAGYYSFGMMIALTPVMIISSAIASVYNREISEIYNIKGDVHEKTKALIVKLIKVILFPFFIFTVFSPHIFELVFGEGWGEAAIYLQILSLSNFLIFIVSILSYLPSLYNKQSKALYIEVASFSLKVLSLTFGCLVFRDVYISLGLYAASSVIVLMFNLIWIMRLTKKG